MAAIQYYDVILKPVITEKSMSGMGEKKYTFLVHTEANKPRLFFLPSRFMVLTFFTFVPSNIFSTARKRDAAW